MGKNICNVKTLAATALMLTCTATPLHANRFTIQQHDTVDIAFAKSQAPVVATATAILSQDLHNVLQATLLVQANTTAHPSHPHITCDIQPAQLEGHKEAFCLSVQPDGTLSLLGSDAHGLAYGLLEISRLIGVSPWEWWADCTPRQRNDFTLPKGYLNRQAPAVEFRGIFINDEDWGLTPWATARDAVQPTTWKGEVGPRTHARIFELLLRLRANTLWPAMHDCTRPFFLTDGNREMAQQYGIYIGTSHCEPMACNVFGEWSVRGQGEYDYLSNSDNVKTFWESRVRETAGQPILYTLGMRGIHDGAMQGAKTVAEQKAVLERVFVDQRNMLMRHVNPDITQVPQVFIPYKEVLDIYNAGLSVPEDVTLMWCDDNYGYIHHMPTAKERARKGGNGVYYHVSYWGRPHDYLWLGTFSPALLLQQMLTAYENDVRKIWILNVGDIKPAEYQIELFMDLAWDGGIAKGQAETAHTSDYTTHLRRFLEREFGTGIARQVLPLLLDYYRLAYICKPEFLGGTRTEEANRKYWNTVRDLPWTLQQMNSRLAAYERLEKAIEAIWPQLTTDRQDAFYQLVKYPVQACAEMNKKILLAQKARHNLAPWTDSWQAYDSIATLTRQYNQGFHNQGKWMGIMDAAPRQRTVFDRIDSTSQSAPLQQERDTLARFNAAQGTGQQLRRWPLLGYEGGCVEIPKGESLRFDFTLSKPSPLSSTKESEVETELHLLPVHPQQSTNIAVQVVLDGHISDTLDYTTYGRSEEWKQNVLRSQAIRKVHLPIACDKTQHRLEIRALSRGVTLDQVFLFTPAKKQ